MSSGLVTNSAAETQASRRFFDDSFGWPPTKGRQGIALEISGIDRLLSYALQLGVKPNRVADSIRPAGDNPVAARSAGAPEDGVRVSLSSRPDPVAATAPTHTSAPIQEIAPRPARVETDGSPAGKAIGAYQRNAPAELGSRIRIRA